VGAVFDHYVTKPIDLEKLRDVLLAVPERDEHVVVGTTIVRAFVKN